MNRRVIWTAVAALTLLGGAAVMAKNAPNLNPDGIPSPHVIAEVGEATSQVPNIEPEFAIGILTGAFSSGLRGGARGAGGRIAREPLAPDREEVAQGNEQKDPFIVPAYVRGGKKDPYLLKLAGSGGFSARTQADNESLFDPADNLRPARTITGSFTYRRGGLPSVEK